MTTNRHTETVMETHLLAYAPRAAQLPSTARAAPSPLRPVRRSSDGSGDGSIPGQEGHPLGAAFWIRRFILVWTAAFVLIAGAQALKGHALAYALTQGLLWATISAGIFVGARLYHSRRGRHCAICRDTPEMRDERGA